MTNPTQRGIKCTVKGEIIGENITFSKDLNLFRGETKEICFTPEEFPQLTIKNPRLWWPIFKGNPELYELKLTVSIDGKVSDETKPVSVSGKSHPTRIHRTNPANSM